jgi:hypothetical protein
MMRIAETTGYTYYGYLLTMAIPTMRCGMAETTGSCGCVMCWLHRTKTAPT